MTAKVLVKENAVVAASGQVMLNLDIAEELLIRFAKYHVRQALDTVAKRKTHGMLVIPIFNDEQKEIITKSYSLLNIK